MTILLIASVILNLLLLLYCHFSYRREQAGITAYDTLKERLGTEIQQAREFVDGLRKENLALAHVVSRCISEIRDDISRNYQHVHEVSILGRIAHEIQIEHGPIRLTESMQTAIADAGGGQFVRDRIMEVSAALQFALYMHAKSRSTASRLFEVVQESCGPTDRAAWLSKSLALYMRICGDSKDEAIKSLTQVLDQWKCIPQESNMPEAGVIDVVALTNERK